MADPGTGPGERRGLCPLGAITKFFFGQLQLILGQL